MASVGEAALPLPAFSSPPRVLVVVAPFYREIAEMLVQGAEATLDRVKADRERIEVPGALEVPAAIKIASANSDFEGFVALGCVVRGATTHYETVCNDSSRGIMMLNLAGLCVGNGILTVENLDQAEERADPHRQNKGGGAAEAALHLVALYRRFDSRAASIGFSAGGSDATRAGTKLK
ncbi:MAG: 6,7-dimethyl-8-ribityllumazine synthase [Albidovulum sp.]|nr:6,7-dimethyl-8-ribityllumazine synthase [Albidovulum sp.]MDE0305045.1 6,7-dimethyl-8-ribityllumazine synthase [Albidovulum sp.]MDE0532841.1 6,7-dimethyl-8-ribityllumazine synthase [Albidovulum sp.]